MTRTPAGPTRAVRAGIGSDAAHGAVVPPLHLSTTFTFEGLDKKRPYDYSRSGNPTRDIAADAIADLEGGAGAVLTSSGMSAIALVLQLLKPDDLICAPHDCYGGTYRLLRAQAEKGHFRLRFFDQTDPSALSTGLKDNPRMVWVETPSNPLLRVTDVSAIANALRDTGALLVVDNTFLSPALQQPLTLGADVVVHSTTKYLNGHSDMVGGAVVSSTPELAEEMAWWGNCTGVTGSSFDSFLLMRGIRTLFPRIREHERNAKAIVEALCRDPAVLRVYHPSLPDHPGHGVASRQQSGYGSMVSFELRGGRPAVAAFVEGLECFTLAESLGGVESLVAHPATMTHASMDEPAREIAGISESLLRLSVGIEASEDLERDLGRALRRAEAVDTALV